MQPELAPNKSYYENCELLIEKRMIYQSKRIMINSFNLLYPFVPMTERNFYNKSYNLIEPNTRTDLCNICNDVDIIFFKL